MTQAAKAGGRAAGTAGRTRAASPPPGTTSEERTCPVAFCPVGLGLSLLQGAAPEATLHLMKAAQELLLAVRAVIDERVGQAGERPADELERIEIS